MVDRGVRVGVDVGSVRVGVAVSDPDGILATPVETVGAGPDGLARLVEIVRESGAALVYVGLPRHLSGGEGSASAAARAYGEQMAWAVAPVPVRLIDERMSTVTAHRSMRAAGRPGRRQRAVADQAAAVVILQHALEVEGRTGERAGELVQVTGGGVEQTEVSG